ncbi:MAG: Hsp20/alpha crystallin family protein [Thermoprotei archaeon]|nr:MAG: Hsp20/alpha crystallin family protein [Thermoprotei archaeon]
MSDWWRKRRRWFDLFDEFLRDIEEEMYRIMREFERSFEEYEKKPPSELRGERRVIGPYVYGFRITIGPDGKPVVEEFGNVRRFRGRPIISEEREPLVDVFENNDEVTVIAEIPGVEKDKISLQVSEDRRKLIIRASDTNRKYYKEVDLPAEVDPGSARANYKNGVLEVKLKKEKKEKKGFRIKVE